MITMYDLESFSEIHIDDAASVVALRGPAPAPWPELRLQVVTPAATAAEPAARDFQAVIAGQVLQRL